MQKYKFRNLSCSIRSDDKLWCVSGQCEGFGSGVLEWCYDDDDANHRRSLMVKDKRMSNLTVERFADSVKTPNAANHRRA